MSDTFDDDITRIWIRPPRYVPPDLPPVPVTAIEPAILARPPRRTGTLVFAALAAIALGSAIAVGVDLLLAARPLAMASFEAPDPDLPMTPDRQARFALSAEESSRARHSRSAPYRDLWRDTAWFHPLADALIQPDHESRKFGAKRRGRRPAECGRGHCGVDVGRFGLAVRAAQDGVVERVQRRATRKEGRYVRILHDDGYVSYYMHLNSIREDLVEGMRVVGGEPIGVVGRTGIRRSAPHLHFALAYRVGRQKVFVDPEPLLRRALVAENNDSSSLIP